LLSSKWDIFPNGLQNCKLEKGGSLERRNMGFQLELRWNMELQLVGFSSMDNFKSFKGSSSLVPLVGSFQLLWTEIPRAYPAWNSFVFRVSLYSSEACRPFQSIPASDLFFQFIFELPPGTS
ncbi:12454_t:CDS:2, partial [Gigaspora rosea]